jgi:kynurenine formamidase
MSCRFLKVQLFVVASTLSIAMLLFAAQRHDAQQTPQFSSVIDLSGPAGPGSNPSQETLLIAPAGVGGVWTVDSLPALRLVAPLAIIQADHKNFPDSESLVTMDDVATYERLHGPVAQGAIVLLASPHAGTAPELDADALHFLVEARNIVGIGSSGAQLVPSEQNAYLAKKGIYQLENVENLSLVPHSGAIAMAAPQKIPGAPESPVRLMALVR